MNDLVVADGTTLHQLWRRLATELANIFDAHGVCHSVAQIMSAALQTTVVVGLSGANESYFDVWVALADGTVSQRRWPVERASFAPILASSGALRLEKFEQEPGELVQSELWQLPRADILGIPLPYPGQKRAFTPSGVLCLVDPQANEPLVDENLVDLAIFITAYLDRAGLRQRSQQQTIEFATVHDISHSLTSTLNLQEIFLQVSDTVRRTLNVEAISVGLVEQDTGDIVFVGELMGPLFQGLPPVRLKPDQGIAGWVASNSKPLTVNDVYKDKRFFATVDRRSGYQTHSILCLPLRIEQRVIGVIEAINKLNGPFNDNDLRLLEAISAPLAVAIENAGLHADVLAEKRRIETIFSSMSEGMLTINGDGIITNANDALLTLLRRSEGELRGQPAGDVIQLSGTTFVDFLGTVMSGTQETPQLAAAVENGDDQPVPVLLSGSAIRNETDTVEEAIITFSDLRQIREVERMRDDFFQNIIHELRTPLATILMYARLLRQGRAKDDDEKADRFLGVIERESDRLQTMVRQMLQLAKLESSTFSRSQDVVDLNAIISQIMAPMADRAVEKGLIFNQRIRPDLPSVYGDKEMLYSIIKNLVDNAVKFTLAGTVRVDAFLEQDMICIKVHDEGIGIPPEALPNLFRRFYRTQTAVERGIAGTGLGLYMVKEGVEKHNGTIHVDSEIGQGTTFTLYLPPATP